VLLACVVLCAATSDRRRELASRDRSLRDRLRSALGSLGGIRKGTDKASRAKILVKALSGLMKDKKLMEKLRKKRAAVLGEGEVERREKQMTKLLKGLLKKKKKQQQQKDAGVKKRLKKAPRQTASGFERPFTALPP
jgi:hypothetical protein